MNSFQFLVRSRREELAMSQFDLAKASGLTIQSIGTLERTGQCRLSTALSVAKALKLNAIPV